MEKVLSFIKNIFPKRLFLAISPAYHFTLAWLAAFIYRFPSNKLIVIGVTGTSGKTSTVYMIAKALAGAGYKAGFSSTAMFSDGDGEWLNDKKMTMVGGLFNQRFLRSLVKNRCQYAIIETTSEGIKQFRHRFINYDILLFTNLFPEHIESHGSYDNYRTAKGELFGHLKRCKTKYRDENHFVVSPSSELRKLDLSRVKKTIIANGDDKEAPYFLNFWSEAKFAYASNSNIKIDDLAFNGDASRIKDLRIVNFGDIEATENGTSFNLEDSRIYLKILGGFNAQNATAAAVCSLSQDIPMDKIKASLESIKTLSGKMEKIDAGQDFTAVVDYAFEPNALTKLYEVVSMFPKKKTIHVLGSCGGGRDRARRPVLGQIAGKNADIVIVTNEDPYDDNPGQIIEDVALGALQAGKEEGQNLFKILDRREAIAKAVALAKAGDFLLVTGKGSEQFICVENGAKIPWDDRAVLKEEIVDNLCIDKNQN